MDGIAGIGSSGDVKLIADQLDIGASVSAGARVHLIPLTTSRAIALGGTDEVGALNLTQAELDNIAASTLVLGQSTSSGGIGIVGASSLVSTPALSLINTGSIFQTGALTVAKLNADGASVVLTNAGNSIGKVSGRATSGAFQVASSTALTVGTVDGVSGITTSTSNGNVVITSAGAVTLANSITSAALGDAVTVAGTDFNNLAGAGAIDARRRAVGRLFNRPGKQLFRRPGVRQFGGVEYHLSQYRSFGQSLRVLAAADGLGDGRCADPGVRRDGDAPTLNSVVTGLVDASLYGDVFTQDVLSGGLAVASPGKNVGSYAITQGTLTAPAGYALNYTGNNFDITPASLTITAKDQSKNEAATFTFAGSEFMTTGLVGGEQVAGVTLTSAGAPASAPVGSYSIKPGAAGCRSRLPGIELCNQLYRRNHVGDRRAACTSTSTSTRTGTKLAAVGGREPVGDVQHPVHTSGGPAGGRPEEAGQREPDRRNPERQAVNKPARPPRAHAAVSAAYACPAVAGFRPAGAVLAVAAAFLSSRLGSCAAHRRAGDPWPGQLGQQGNNLVVTTLNGPGTNHSAINWQSFSVPTGTTTRFDQPNAASLSINRVMGNDPSAIFGTFSSNGRLVLVNPSGIAVGAGAVVDTAGFTASTLRMSDADALAGRLVFGGDGLGGGALSVDGGSWRAAATWC